MANSVQIAAVQAVPIYMNKDASIGKVVSIVHDAGARGLQLLVFPEVFVPGYPAFIMAYPPLQYASLIAEYSEHSVLVYDRQGQPSGDIRPILSACAECSVSLVLGISERSSQSPHTLFNSQIFISSAGAVLGVHRKIMPTYAEKSVWASGGGATLKCWDMPISTSNPEDEGSTLRIGGLACGENTIYGAKDALTADGQQLHAASWPAMCAYRPTRSTYSNRIKVLSESHAYCAGAFVVAASTIIRQEHLDWIEERLGPDPRKILVEGAGWSGIVDPSVGVLAEESGMEEKLVIATIDLTATKGPGKVTSDLAGHYRRPEVLKLHVDRSKIWDDDLLVASSPKERIL